MKYRSVPAALAILGGILAVVAFVLIQVDDVSPFSSPPRYSLAAAAVAAVVLLGATFGIWLLNRGTARWHGAAATLLLGVGLALTIRLALWLFTATAETISVFGLFWTGIAANVLTVLGAALFGLWLYRAGLADGRMSLLVGSGPQVGLALSAALTAIPLPLSLWVGTLNHFWPLELAGLGVALLAFGLRTVQKSGSYPVGATHA